MKYEILAPCGSWDSLLAAVRCGANAVYLGMADFNARRHADNFDMVTLQKAAEYCHVRGVSLYVTLNTLIADEEMHAACQTAQTALQCGADGLIVQDLGLAALLKRSMPSVRLHASTQCSVATPEGFRALEELGFCRAVLPREMTLEEIRAIHQNTSMELELFVHGALCMCVSGQCYLSSVLGGRSGNRGLCAQPCRLPFSADASGSCDLSLKDLSLIQHLPSLEGSGVVSLKIEGRMKRPEYVAAAVTACKKALAGQYTSVETHHLQSVFSRSGFTDAYFTGTRKGMFGTRRKEDVTAAPAVLKELAQLYAKEQPLLPLDITCCCRAEQPMKLTVCSGNKTVCVTGVTPEAARHKPMTQEMLQTRLSKLGGTPYYTRCIRIEMDEGITVSAGAINALRRQAIEELEKTALPAVPDAVFTKKEAKEKQAVPYFTARFTAAAQIPEKHPFQRIFLPVWEKEDAFVATGAGVELPRGLFGAQERLIADLKRLKACGVTQVLAGNLGAYKIAEALGFDVYGDFGLNIFNSETAGLFHAPVLSPELTLQQANCINHGETGLLAYGKLPLMLMRNCPIKAHIGCARCGHQGVLTDRKGYAFPVRCSSYPCVELLNPIPLALSDKWQEIKTDFIHFYFTDESRDEIEKIIHMYQTAAEFPSAFTRGLYFKGVQ